MADKKEERITVRQAEKEEKEKQKDEEIPLGTFSPRPEDSPFRRVSPEVAELQKELDQLKADKGVKRDKDAEFREAVNDFSVCGVCLQAFDNNQAPIVEKVDDTFNDKPIFSAIHSRCEDKPVRVYVVQDDPNTPKKISEVVSKNTDKARKEREKRD